MAERPVRLAFFSMNAVRVVAAAVLAASAWWLAASLPEWFELGPWYAVLMLFLFLFGPGLLAALLALPRVRGSDMMVPGVAAALPGRCSSGPC